MPKILLGTSNVHKISELKLLLDIGNDIDIVTLQDLDIELEAPEETGISLYENALLKAKFYAEQTGLPTLSEDTGFFIPSLDNWPGIYAARIADSQQGQISQVLKKLDGTSGKARNALFETVVVLYEPNKKSIVSTVGSVAGTVSLEVSDNKNTFGFDPIFIVDEVNKTFAEMSQQQKNSCSHRSKAIFEMSHAIRKLYNPKQFVVPLGIIIKDEKILMSKRNDPYNDRYHNKWEFPGGGVDFGENIRDCLVREVREEVGYDVEIIKQLDYIHNFSNTLSSGFGYTAFLVPYLCKIVGGDGVWCDNETNGVDFYDVEKIFDEDLLEQNDILLKAIMPEIKQYIRNQK